MRSAARTPYKTFDFGDWHVPRQASYHLLGLLTHTLITVFLEGAYMLFDHDSCKVFTAANGALKLWGALPCRRPSRCPEQLVWLSPDTTSTGASGS